MKKVLLDVHTHTVASGHAYSSLQEMVKAASDKGLQVLNITEYGPNTTLPATDYGFATVVPSQRVEDFLTAVERFHL